MKLQFLKPYPNSSITVKFDDIEINDFAVITGKNGVGKTHLLEAIVHNDNYINIDNGMNAIYFNYNDFIVENTIQNQSKNKAHLKKKNSNANNIEQDLQNIRQKFNSLLQIPLRNLFREYSSLINHVYSFAVNRVNCLDIPTFEDFQSNLLKFTSDINLLETIYDKLKLNLKNLQQERNEKLDKYYQKSIELNIPLLQLNKTHFEYKETWLGQLLENEFKTYIKAFDQTQRQIMRNSSKEITQFQIEEQTLKIVGIAPWLLLNEILERYNCNGYLIDKDLAYCIEPYQNIDQQALKIVLKNYETNQIVNLDRLSSGEKTLFALAVALYRQEKDENLPTVLLLDEIDSSLHPSMCRQLLDVLENVFVQKHGLKIIMITHSPSTVALAPENAVYVMENNNGKINLHSKSKQEAISFLSDGFATINDGKILFENILNSEHNIILFTEGETDIDHINTAKEKLGISDLNFNIYSCDCAMKLKQFLMGIPKGLGQNKKIIGIFDYDEEGLREAKGLNGVIKEKSIYKRNDVDNIYSITLPCPNKYFQELENCPIEFLYPKEKIPHTMLERLHLKNVNNKLEQEQISSQEYQNKKDLHFFKLTKNANKRQFSLDVKNFEKDDFTNFIELFNILKSL